ncbi:MAG TPA: hypothetical protein DHV68_04010 [Dehalococcoidia bacterium]|nr:hypothetical protein [Dehalococcoidia bacterium]
MNSFLKSVLVRYLLVPIAGVVVLVIFGGGWYFSSVLEEDGLRVDNDPGDFLVKITGITDNTITLRQIKSLETEENLAISALWGITNGESYGQLGDLISEDDGLITREFTLLEGEFRPGTDARFERTPYPHDPYLAHELDYVEVFIEAPLGDIGAWLVEVDSDAWVILVHGRTSNRDSSLKILDDLYELNVNSLTIDYRNDEDAPPSESGYYDFGVTEWEDLEAAVQYALDDGAQEIILVGYSMGGGVVVNYQLRSPLSQHTNALILEAPMLNFGRTVDKGAQERSVPYPITAVAKTLASFRFGVDWGAIDYLSRADEIDVPVLLMHGEEDDTVPLETSIEFAEALPNLVEFHAYPEVGHVAIWNWHPDEYEELVTEFIERHR